VPEVDATLSNTTAGIAGLVVPLHPAGPGHYVAYGFNVPIPGTWSIRVTVRTDNLNEYFADPITVHIR
jgi:copper transport protein